MAERLTDLQKVERNYLHEIKVRDGLTISQLLALQADGGKKFDLGTGLDAIDLVDKFQNLGFLGYRPQTGEFIVIDDQN